MKVQELVASLDVPSGAERQCLERLGLHVVVPVLMNVDVISKMEEAMLDELNGLTSYHGAWDQQRRESVL